MALLPLAIPAGIQKNGTNFQQANAWNNGNLVRWYEQAMQPVGGWRKRSTSAMTGICRALLCYTDNSDNRRSVAGTESHLYAITEGGTKYDITPAGFTTGTADANQNLGWGGATYSLSTWGTPRPDTISYIPVTTWSLDTWGEYVVGCSTTDGKIYQWANNTGVAAAILSNAPTSNTSILTTNERFVFALGAGGEADRVEWSDQENNNVWAASATNQAGGQNLTTNGKIITGVSLRGETLILTDVDAHVARYSGPPFVYGFNRVGTGCGITSANSCVVAGQSAFWVGQNAFHIYNGSVRTLPSAVGDFFFANINEAQRSKICGVLNSGFNEIFWFYPSQASNENDSYVSYNYVDNIWSIGSLARTAGVDVGVFAFPQLVGSDSYVYEHEVGAAFDADVIPFIQSGPIEIGAGDNLMVARSLIPDENTQGDVTAEFITRNYPNGATETHGPYSMANPTDVRFTGREVSMKVTSATANSWRVGTMRLDVVAGSKR